MDCLQIGAGAGRIREGLNKLNFRDGQLFYLYVPRRVIAKHKAARILVSVHGYSVRKANANGRARVKRYAEYWSNLANEKGWVVLAPHFDERRFNNDYQRLNFSGMRADVRLHQLVDEIGRLLPGIPTAKISLFGFSGGGQFVHRYVAFNPERVDRAVCGAPGWYIWPEQALPYPIGTDSNSLPNGLRPRLRELCRANFLLIVGENDSTQGIFRKRYKVYDLVSLQGEGRKERAENWVAALRKFAIGDGSSCRIVLKIVSHTGHCINKKLLECAGEYLSGR